MKSFLIKLKKSYFLWRRSGFWEGAKTLLDYFNIYIKSFFIESGDVLFISSGVGDSAYYRVHNQAEELRLHGFKVATTSSDNPNLPKLADKFKVFIFHRTVYNSYIKKLIQRVKKQKKEIIFDTDDLVYDPRYLVYMDYFQKMSATEQKLYEKGIGTEILNDSYVKVVTTTVSFLADKLRERGTRVIIVSNKFSEAELKLTDDILKIQKQRDNYVRIAYCSGTLSHNKDFATIKDALLKIINKYKKVKLLLIGPLDIPEELGHLKKQIEIIPRASRGKFYHNLYKADINLAPLELDNPFCESKSAIKFTESGILKIPTVAVRNQTFSEAIENGVDGFLADNTEEWVEKISQLIENKELRRMMGEKARTKVLEKYTDKNSDNQEYYDYIRSKIQA